MRILICFGTRPEAIKMAPVIYELKRQQIPVIICVTAQHREMLDQVLDFFKIVPDFDLDIMKPDQSLNILSSEILIKIDHVIDEAKPNFIFVQGDTTTAFITAFAAFNRKIKVGHIEAGLRTYDKSAPFPEEGNRQLISRLTDFHFAPTKKAKMNLLDEGIREADIFLTGNTVVDALEYGKKVIRSGLESEEIETFKNNLNLEKKLILVTGHRRENFGQGMKDICEAMLEIAKRKDVQILFPVHLNPQVKEIINQKLAAQRNILLTEPLGYLSLLWILDKCDLIISDSGGIQEEAPSFQKPLLVTREVSERMEGVETGFAILTGTSKLKIVNEANRLLNDPPDFIEIENPYGNGRASERIVEVLKQKI